MKDIELSIFTFIGLIFCAPFIFMTLLTAYFGYEKDKTWSLIVLGMATAGLPIAALGGFRIIQILTNEEPNSREVKHD